MDAVKEIKKKGIDEQDIIKRAARGELLVFSKYMMPGMKIQPFHVIYYYILNLFAHGKIKKLIITMPPQHGKSEGSSRKLPAFIHGLNPDAKIGIGCYSATVAQDFNTDVQRIIDTPEYAELFPGTYLSRSKVVDLNNVYKRNSNVYECVNRLGSLRAVGRGGALTSKSIDIMIMDDVYKDYEEGNSPIIREKAWNWYTAVVRTRLHNDSQELIVFTRWNDDDLIGRLAGIEEIVEIKDLNDLENIPQDAWVKINYQALKDGEPTPIDPREDGQALWEGKHSQKKLEGYKKLDPMKFDCLYQGEPETMEGILYRTFKTYKEVDEYGRLIGKGNYTDVADEGDDYLCSISYDKVKGKDEDGSPCIYILVKDLVYTQDKVEETTEYIPMLFQRAGTKYSNIESNNGGKSFALIVRRNKATKKAHTKVKWFHQSKNKESRIKTNAGLVTTHIIMPYDWAQRWPEFYKHVTKYKKDFKANKHDDAPDTLTGIIEKEVLKETKKGIKRTN